MIGRTHKASWTVTQGVGIDIVNTESPFDSEESAGLLPLAQNTLFEK
jgi:hypothetical protein